MRCLVTGGAGFIGSHLCEALVKKGHQVVCMDDLSSGKLENIPDGVDFVRGDVNSGDIAVIFKENKFDHVFHYSATVGIKRCIEQEKRVLADLQGSKTIANHCIANDVKRLFFASSSEVYGDSKNPMKEDKPGEPRYPYGKVKQETEDYLMECHRKNNLPVTILRFFNVYGPKQDSTEYGYVVGIFTKALKEGKPPPVFGDGSQTRDFVYIKDNISATLEIAKSKKTIGHAINIGTGVPTTVLELAEHVIALSRKTYGPEFVKNKFQDIENRVADISKIKSMLGWKPSFTLPVGLRETMGAIKTK